MTLTLAIPAAGAMGAGVAARLIAHGATVLTSLTGRSPASVERARAAGMRDATDAELVDADFLLSIVPPDQALAVAQRFAARLREARRKPVVLDCNAINPATATRVAACLHDTGCAFVDAGIFGPPPRPGTPGPLFYVSGPQASRALQLEAFGLRVRRIEGEIGAASALKMSYGGITKGLTALTACLALAADRHGIARELHDELASSQPHLMALFARVIPDMFGKAYRWAPEMEQVAEYLGTREERRLFEGAAALYRHLAADARDSGEDVQRIARFVAGS